MILSKSSSGVNDDVEGDVEAAVVGDGLEGEKDEDPARMLHETRDVAESEEAEETASLWQEWAASISTSSSRWWPKLWRR